MTSQHVIRINLYLVRIDTVVVFTLGIFHSLLINYF